MPKPPTLSEILKYKGLSFNQINRQCTRDHLLKIARSVAGWENVASFLGLESTDQDDIRTKFPRDSRKQTEEMLLMWKEKFGATGTATYKVLMEVFLTVGKTNLVETTCDIFKSNPPPATPEDSPPVMSTSQAHMYTGGIHPPMHHPPSQLPHHGQQLSYPSYQQPTQSMGYQQPSQQLGQPTSHLPNQPPYQQQRQPPHQQPSYPYPQLNQPMGYQQPSQQLGQLTSHLPNQPPYQHQQPDQPPLQQLPTQLPYQQSSRSAPHQLDLSSGHGRLPPNPTDPYYAAPPSTQPVLTPQNQIPHPNKAASTTGGCVAVDSSSPTTSPTAKLKYSDFTIVDNPQSSTLFSNPTDEVLQTAFPVKYWKGLAEIHQQQLKDGRYLRGGGTVLAVLDAGINNLHAAFNQQGKVITEDYVGDGIGTYRAMSDHGTHCAGVAAGLPYHNAYVTSSRSNTTHFPGGVAPDAKLVMSRVWSEGVYCSNAVHMALQDLELPGHLRADVISMSFGVHGDERQQWKQLLEPTIKSLVTGNKHTICVAAASNVGATTRKGEGIAYPALDENVLSIGAHDKLGYKSKITPPEDKIDFLALGEYVWAPSATDDRALICSTGTSCATPAVAGLICLIIQYARDVTGNAAYTPALPEITNILRGLTRNPTSAEKCEGEGYGPLVIDSFEQFKTAVINVLQPPPLLMQTN